MKLRSSEVHEVCAGYDDALQGVVVDVVVVRDRWFLRVNVEVGDMVHFVDIGDDASLTRDGQSGGRVVTYAFCLLHCTMISRRAVELTSNDEEADTSVAANPIETVR